MYILLNGLNNIILYLVIINNKEINRLFDGKLEWDILWSEGLLLLYISYKLGLGGLSFYILTLYKSIRYENQLYLYTISKVFYIFLLYKFYSNNNNIILIIIVLISLILSGIMSILELNISNIISISSLNVISMLLLGINWNISLIQLLIYMISYLLSTILLLSYNLYKYYRLISIIVISLLSIPFFMLYNNKLILLIISGYFNEIANNIIVLLFVIILSSILVYYNYIKIWIKLHFSDYIIKDIKDLRINTISIIYLSLLVFMLILI